MRTFVKGTQVGPRTKIFYRKFLTRFFYITSKKLYSLNNTYIFYTAEESAHYTLYENGPTFLKYLAVYTMCPRAFYIVTCTFMQWYKGTVHFDGNIKDNSGV